ncbi:hypothetical protein [Pseudoduganella sp. UC29_71]|uniref:hypothetical protein n=1 Tax=Pseudoduganella sp. UC29_71 TaxID=3350174 RepID=UPI003671081C
MKAVLLGIALLAFSAPALADDLADAQKAWESKDYGRAFKAFSALAKAGNGAAQLQLGEMFGFGEGTAEDAVQAEHWLKQAQAAGVPEAAASLELVRERHARKAEIAYFTEHFDGADRAYSNYGCTRPLIPAQSATNAEIAAVNSAVNTWAACHGRFVTDLNKSLPATNTISPGVLKLMSNAEYQRASALIEKVYEKIAVDAQRIADQIGSENAAWKAATEKFAADSNEKIAGKAASDKARFERFNLEEQDAVQRRINAANGVRKQ